MNDLTHKDHIQMCAQLMLESVKDDGSSVEARTLITAGAQLQATLAIVKQLETTNELLTRIVAHLDNAEMLNS